MDVDKRFVYGALDTFGCVNMDMLWTERRRVARVTSWVNGDLPAASPKPHLHSSRPLLPSFKTGVSHSRLET